MTASLRAQQRLRLTTELHTVALELFEAEGYDQVTIEHVAAAAGVSASTVYRSFGTKEGLVVGSELGQPLADALEVELGSSPPDRAVRRAVTAVLPDDELVLRRFQFLAAHPNLWAVAVQTVLGHGPAIAQGVAVARGADQTSLRDDVQAASMLVAVAVALDHWQARDRAASLDVVLDRAFAALRD